MNFLTNAEVVCVHTDIRCVVGTDNIPKVGETINHPRMFGICSSVKHTYESDVDNMGKVHITHKIEIFVGWVK